MGHAALEGQEDEVGAAANTEFVQEIGDVELYGAFGDVQFAGDFLVGKIFEQGVQNFLFAAAQIGDGIRLDAAALAGLLAGRKSPLKAALLDQSLIAGLGNIYVCEALHRAGLSPRLEAGAVATLRGGPTAKARRLTDAIRAVLEEAVAAGGSTLRDHRQTDGELGYFQHSFLVYGKEGAACSRARCGGTILRIVQAGRSTFYCPACQR